MLQVIDAFKEDHPDPVDCNVKGRVPRWLEGSLYRNGPAKFEFGEDKALHVFDGMAVIHQYRIKDGHVTYHNKYLNSDTYQRNKAANRIVMSEFGVVARPDPCKSIFTRYFSYFAETVAITDNDCVNLMQLGDQIYTMSETPIMNKIDPISLDRIEPVDWRKYVSVHLASAHPMAEPDGTVYNIGTAAGPHSSYKIIKIPAPQPGETNPVRSAYIVGSIPSQWPLMPNYSHSFSMTDNYFIFIEQPLAFNLLEIGTSRIRGKPINEALHFFDGYKTKFHVVHKYTGAEIELKYEAKPFFVFHQINAYEERGQVVVDLATYEDASIMGDLVLENMRSQTSPRVLPLFKRFVLPLSVNTACKNSNLVRLDYTTATSMLLDDGSVYCVPETIDDSHIELPRIHYEKYNGKKYNYAYGIHATGNYHNKLVKLDVQTGNMIFWSEPDYYPGEPVFVADPGGHEEDDGVILSPVIRLKDDLESYLLVLDARTFTEVCRAYVPGDINIPLSFHGIFTSLEAD